MPFQISKMQITNSIKLITHKPKITMQTIPLEGKNNNKSINKSTSNSYRCMQLSQQTETFQKIKMLQLKFSNKELSNNMMAINSNCK